MDDPALVRLRALVDHWHVNAEECDEMACARLPGLSERYAAVASAYRECAEQLDAALLPGLAAQRSEVQENKEDHTRMDTNSDPHTGLTALTGRDPMSKKEYIGDGVYVDFDGWALVLTTENGIETTNRIVLETDVYTSLVNYVEALKAAAMLNGPPGAASPAPQSWQEISTAPTNGTPFIALTAAGEVFRCHWSELYSPTWATTEEFYAGGSFEPSYWMPLPDAPRPASTAPVEEKS